jgi:hypothetical protein
MKYGRVLGLAWLLLLIVGTSVCADNGTSGEALPVLRFGVGARAFAMGGAYGVIANDSTAVYWNPAGLAQTKQTSLQTMHSELFLGTAYDYVGWATPVGKGGFGINLLRLSTPGIILVENGVTVGEDSAAVDVIYLGYGTEWYGWQIGLSGKYLREKLPTATGDGWSFDLGLQKPINDRFRIGLAVQDIAGTDVKWDNGLHENIPANYRAGFSYSRDNLLMVLEEERAGDFSESHFGVEFSITDFLKIRSGLRGNDFTAGIGINKNNYQFDYAYCAGDLGNTHRLSFGMRL